MGNKDSYAKGIMLHQWVETVDWDNLDADFVVLRLGQTGYPNYATGAYVDIKYAAFVQEAKNHGLPVLAWYELYPKIYGDTSWPVDDYNRWYAREQDMSMTVIDRMLATRPYWHGMVVSVNPGVYNATTKTFDTSPLWVSRSLRRVMDLVKSAYGKKIWPEFANGVIDNKNWDTQGMLELDSQNWDMCAWDYTKSSNQFVNGMLDLYALAYPEEHMPMYLMPDRTGCLWRVKTVTWSGAKTKAGATIALPVYLYYGSKDSLYKTIGFTASAPTTPDTGNDTPETPGAGDSVNIDLAETNALLTRIAVAVEKIAGVLK